MKHNRESIIPAILLIASIVLFFICCDWEYSIGLLSCVGAVIIIVSLFTDGIRVKTAMWVVGFIMLAFFEEGAWDLFAGWYLIISIPSYIFMIIIKFKNDRSCVIAGTVIHILRVALYMLFLIGIIVSDSLDALAYLSPSYLNLIAVLFIWRQETKHIPSKEKPAETANTDIGFNPKTLATLKQLYESGRITEQQYRAMIIKMRNGQYGNTQTETKGNMAMKFCQHCGAQVHEKAVVCVKCGCSLAASYYEEDIPSTGLNVLSFLIPVVGLILYIVYHERCPNKAKAIGKWAIIGFCIGLVLSILSICGAMFR